MKGRGNVFTCVCHSVHRELAVILSGITILRMGCPPRMAKNAPLPRMAENNSPHRMVEEDGTPSPGWQRTAGCMHPTGMLFYYLMWTIKILKCLKPGLLGSSLLPYKGLTSTDEDYTQIRSYQKLIISVPLIVLHHLCIKIKIEYGLVGNSLFPYLGLTCY